MYPAARDTKYQSVYVISEEKDECVVATEVSVRCEAQRRPGPASGRKRVEGSEDSDLSLELTSHSVLWAPLGVKWK